VFARPFRIRTASLSRSVLPPQLFAPIGADLSVSSLSFRAGSCGRLAIWLRSSHPSDRLCRTDASTLFCRGCTWLTRMPYSSLWETYLEFVFFEIPGRYLPSRQPFLSELWTGSLPPPNPLVPSFLSFARDHMSSLPFPFFSRRTAFFPTNDGSSETRPSL